MIIYLHGFSSAPASHKATVLSERLVLCEFKIPAYPFEHPDQAIAELGGLVQKKKNALAEPLVVMGSSLGGFYAQYLAAHLDAVNALIMINPALEPATTLAPYTGEHVNMVSGEAFTFTKEDLAALKKYYVPPVAGKPVLLLLDEKDEIINSKIAANRYANTGNVLMYPEGNHHFAHLEEAMPEIRKFYYSL
ncbi:MAG: YqiA/YcfP family alpha/beta fold hydrolase [Thiotrichales bacterium]